MSGFVRSDSEQTVDSNNNNNASRANFAEYFVVVGLSPVELQQQVKDNIIARNKNDDRSSLSPMPEDNNVENNNNSGEFPTRKRSSSKGALSPSMKVENIFQTVFKAHIIDRYPYENGAQDGIDMKQTTPFPSGLPLFCFPDGYKFSRDNCVPSFFTFVSTGAGGEHVYGHCLTIHDLISPAAYAVLHSAGNIPGLPEPDIILDVTSDGNNNNNNSNNNKKRRSRSNSQLRRQSIVATMYAPKCLCLITRYPFISQCRDILTSLYRLVLSPLDVPIERYICNLMNEVPMPPSGMAKILYSIADKELIFTRPPVNRPIENIDLPFDKTFQCIGIRTTLSIFKCLLLEQKILFHSSQLSLLTAVAECIMAFLYPFSWEHVYIPVLPRPLLGVLQAPMPFICGMQTGIFDEIQDEIPCNVVVVNIDKDEIFIPDANTANDIPPLPEKEEQKLVKALQEIAEPVRLNRPGGGDDDIWRETCLNMMDSAFSYALRADQFDDDDELIVRDWYKLRLAFLRFFVAMFREYKKYVITKTSKKTKSHSNSSSDSPSAGTGKFFDVKSFVNAQRSSSKTFLNIFTQTQTFSKFMDDCVHEDQEEANYDVKFFNESIAQKRNRSLLTFRKYSTPFLESEKHEIQKTVVCFAPDKANLPQPPPLTEKTFDGHGSGDMCGQYTYSYDCFPSLQKSLFIDPRPLPEMPIDPKEASASSRRKNAGFWVTHPGTKKEYNSDSTIYCVWFLTLAAISSNDVQDMNGPTTATNNKVSNRKRMKSSVKRRRQQLRRLGSAFEILNRMKQQQIGRDELIYKSLIDASGRCGSTHHALLVLKHMKEDGLKPDSLFFSCLASAFSMDTTIPMVGTLPLGLLDAWEDNMKDDDQKNTPSSTPQSAAKILSSSSLPSTAKKTSAMSFSSYFGYGKKPPSTTSVTTKRSTKKAAITIVSSTTELKNDTTDIKTTSLNEPSKKQVADANGIVENISEDPVVATVERETKDGNITASAAVHEAIKTPEKTKKKKLHLKLTEDSKNMLHLTPTLSSLVSPRGTGFRILESVFPTLSIDTDRETCPKCNRKVNLVDVWNGFTDNDPNDYTTLCPDETCGRRFVARFTVFSTAEDWVGTLGPKKPLFFEALSPWGLKKEVRTILINSGGVALTSAESFRSSSPTIFWNLVLYFRQFSLPLDFLVLQEERETIKLKLIRSTNNNNEDIDDDETADLEESDQLDSILSSMLNNSNNGRTSPRSILDTLEKADQRLHEIMAKIGPNWRHQMKGSPEVAAVEAASKARLELDSVLGRIDSSSTEDIGDDVDRAVAHVDVAVSMNKYIRIYNIFLFNFV